MQTMLQIDLFVFWAAQLFFIGCLGLLSTQNNLVFMFLSIEIIFLSAISVCVVSSVCYGDVVGQIFVLCILTVAAAESAVGLALLVLLYKLRGTIAYSFINLIKG